MVVRWEACKIGSGVRKAKLGPRNRGANRTRLGREGRAVVALLTGLVVLGLAAIWFFGAAERSTGRGEAELAPRTGTAPPTAGTDLEGTGLTDRECLLCSAVIEFCVRGEAENSAQSRFGTRGVVLGIPEFCAPPLPGTMAERFA